MAPCSCTAICRSDTESAIRLPRGRDAPMPLVVGEPDADALVEVASKKIFSWLTRRNDYMLCPRGSCLVPSIC
eukprot:7391592-Prymnesium_polylepis.2